MFRFFPLTHSLNISVISPYARNCEDRPQDKETTMLHIVRACATYDLAVLLTEINEHLAIALSHVLRHGKDTGYIVVEEWILFLKSRANRWEDWKNMGPKLSQQSQIQVRLLAKYMLISPGEWLSGLIAGTSTPFLLIPEFPQLRPPVSP